VSARGHPACSFQGAHQQYRQAFVLIDEHPTPDQARVGVLEDWKGRPRPRPAVGSTCRSAASATPRTRCSYSSGGADREDSRVDRLSRGDQQRVQLAVALVHDPDLLVLDGPFAGLDPIAVC
jgi:ABC-type glutathione transport system ATPase component